MQNNIFKKFYLSKNEIDVNNSKINNNVSFSQTMINNNSESGSNIPTHSSVKLYIDHSHKEPSVKTKPAHVTAADDSSDRSNTRANDMSSTRDAVSGISSSTGARESAELLALQLF